MSDSYLHTGTATTEEELPIARMLSGIALGGVNSHATKQSPLEAAEALGLDHSAAENLQQILRDQELLNRKFDSAGGNPVDEELYPSSTGKDLLAKYRRIGARGSDVRSERYLAATRAILRWRDAEKGMAVLGDIAETPYGYFYGDALQDDELKEAFDHLLEQGLLKKFGSASDPTLGLELTPLGKQCVIRHDADIEQLERASRSNSVNHTYNVGTVGNFVAGDNHGTMNAWMQVQNPQEAAALLAAAVRIASLNGDFEDENSQAIAKECHEGLIEAANTNATPERRKRLADKVRALAMLAATKSTETATTVLATQGIAALLGLLTGTPASAS